MSRCKKKSAIKICAVFCIVLSFGILHKILAQTKFVYESPTKPVNCEEAYFYINDALIRYNKEGKNNYLILVSKLGTNETSRRLNLNRIKTLKGYIQNVKPYVKAIFVEGESVSGYGVIEIYLDGDLLYSLPIARGRNLDLRSCLL